LGLQTDALLGFANTRTLPDEMVFIIYHQVNELILNDCVKLTKHASKLETAFWNALCVSRYFDMLTTSFSIMENGMR
jgi:tryptophan 2,3-dioxygenase